MEGTIGRIINKKQKLEATSMKRLWPKEFSSMKKLLVCSKNGKLITTHTAISKTLIFLKHFSAIQSAWHIPNAQLAF